MANGNPHRYSMEPHATISAQDLVQGQPDRCGFLRKRGQRERVLENFHLSRHINWRQRFVILQDGCCYCFADEVAKEPLQTFSLQGYNKIFRSRSERAAFVFTLEPAGDCQKKVHTFSATTEDERMAWMQKFREAMSKANHMDPTPIRSSLTDPEDVYVELEKPVYMPALPRRSAMDPEASPEEEECDSGDDSDYDRPDEDLLQVMREHRDRKHLPLPPVPQGQSGEGQVSPPLPAPRRPDVVTIPRSKPSPPSQAGGSGEGGAAGRSKPPDPRHRPAVPLPTAATTGPLEASPPDPARRPKPPTPGAGSRAQPALTPNPRPAAAAARMTRRLSESDCFFDNSDRDAAIEILRESDTPGTFLIRKSRHGDSKVLVVMTTEGVKEYKIFTENQQVSLDKKMFFNTVDDLLNHHSRAPLPNRQQTLGRSYSSASSSAH